MSASAASWTIASESGRTTAAWDAPVSGDTRVVFVCAHGAGGHMSDRSVLAMAGALCDRGIGVVRFNFFYREAKSSRPDPMPRLLACWRAVLERVRLELTPETLIVGGRSMGGRAASMLVAEGEPSDGLLLLAYPLHPPGHPEKLRASHLPAIARPVLCINGTRDPFCEPQLMQTVLATLGANWRMHWLAEADHSFHVLKRSGRTDAEVIDEAAAAVSDWTESIHVSKHQDAGELRATRDRR